MCPRSVNPSLTVENRKSKVKAKLLDEDGNEVPPSEYDLHIGDQDFCFKLKNPKSGKYKVVVSNDAGEDEADVNMKFIGN